jgi:hypothetical protein
VVTTGRVGRAGCAVNRQPSAVAVDRRPSLPPRFLALGNRRRTDEGRERLVPRVLVVDVGVVAPDDVVRFESLDTIRFLTVLAETSHGEATSFEDACRASRWSA